MTEDTRVATIPKLCGELTNAKDDRDELGERLAYAFEEIRKLRARLDVPLMQASAPRDA